MLGNPSGAKQLLFDEGYEVPNNLSDLVQAIKELVRKQGKPIIQKLLRIHPERELILATDDQRSGNKKDFDSYQPGPGKAGGCGCGCKHDSYTGCGCQHDSFSGCGCKHDSYTGCAPIAIGGQHDNFIDNIPTSLDELKAQLAKVDTDTVLDYLRQLKSELKANPDDPLLKQEHDAVVDELDQRDPKTEPKPGSDTQPTDQQPAPSPSDADGGGGGGSSEPSKPKPAKQTSQVMQVFENPFAILASGLLTGLLVAKLTS